MMSVSDDSSCPDAVDDLMRMVSGTDKNQAMAFS